MQYFPALFGKELYIFQTDLLSIICNTVFTAIGICHTGYVVWNQFHPDLTSRQSP